MKRSTDVWDGIFAQQGRVFTTPHENMSMLSRILKDREARTVLDLGRGTGRHVVCLAKRGFSVFGLDSSAEGIRATRGW